MRLTDRDRALLQEIALHQVMTRAHLVSLGYFTSVSRANARLLALLQAGYLRRVAAHPHLTSTLMLYAVTRQGAALLEPHIEHLVNGRLPSVLQLDHALLVLEIRLALLQLGMDEWIAEPLARHRYAVSRGSQRRIMEFRPDGVARFGKSWLFIEADRGNVSLPRIKEKLKGYAHYATSGLLAQTYNASDARLLIVTTGKRRQAHLEALAEAAKPLSVTVRSAEPSLALVLKGL